MVVQSLENERGKISIFLANTSFQPCDVKFLASRWEWYRYLQNISNITMEFLPKCEFHKVWINRRKVEKERKVMNWLNCLAGIIFFKKSLYVYLGNVTLY